MSDIYKERGDKQRSMDFLERVMAYNPYYPMAFEEAMQRLVDEGRLDRASEIAAKGLVFNPDAARLAAVRAASVDNQNAYFKAICRIRGSAADRIKPNVAVVLKFVAGLPPLRWFGRLNASARNSIKWFS